MLKINSCIHIENEKCWLNCIKSLQRLLNVNSVKQNVRHLVLDLNNFFTEHNFNFYIIIFQCGNYLSSHFTVPYLCHAFYFLRTYIFSYLTRLRISAHQLYVETGRYCSSPEKFLLTRPSTIFFPESYVQFCS